MLEREGTKRPPVPTPLGGTAGKAILLHLLLLLVLLCPWDISSASSHFNVGNEGFEMDEAFGVSINEAAEAPAGPAAEGGQNGEALIQKLLDQGVDHAEVGGDRSAQKKFGWPVLGSAGSLVLLMAIVTAWAFAAAAPRDGSLPTVHHEKDEKKEEEEKQKMTSRKGLKEEGEEEVAESQEALPSGGEETAAPEPPQEHHQKQEGQEGEDMGTEVEVKSEEEQEKVEKEAGGEEESVGKEQRDEKAGEEGEEERAEKEGEKEKVKRKQEDTAEEEEDEEEEEEEEEECNIEYAVEQLQQQQLLRACWFPAQSLGASLNQPMSTVLLGQLKEHMDAAEQHQSAAEVGDHAAVAAIAAANQAVANDLAALEQLAGEIVVTGAAAAFMCPDATLIADAAFASLVLESTGATPSYQQAWDQAVRMCNDSIDFQKDEAMTIRTQLQSFPPLQQQQLGRLPERLSAARVAVDAIHRCLKMQEAAKVVARQLNWSCSQLFANSCLGRLEVVSTKGAVLQGIASALLEGAKTLTKMRPMGPEDARPIDKWSLSFTDGHGAQSSMNEQMEVLRGAKRLQEAKAAADAAEEAGVHMSKALDGLIRDLARFWKRHEQLGKSEVENTVAHPPGLPSLDGQVKSVLKTKSQAFVAAAEEAEKLVLDVGNRIELQVARLRDLPWVPLVVLEDVKKALQLVMENTRKNRQEVVELVGRLQEEGSLDGLLSALDLTAKSSLALAEHRVALFRLQEEVEMLALLQGLVDNAGETREAALQMVVGTKTLQQAELQRAEELQEQMEQTIVAAREAASLPAVVHAVGEYVSASEKLHQLVWNRTFSSFIPKDAVTVAATQQRPFDPLQREASLIAAKSTKGGDIELRAPVQAASVAAVSEDGKGFMGQKAQETVEEGLTSETAPAAEGAAGAVYSVSGEETARAGGGEFGRETAAAQVEQGNFRGDEQAGVVGGELGAEKPELAGGLGGEAHVQVEGGRISGDETPVGTEKPFSEEKSTETRAGDFNRGAMTGTGGGPSGGKGPQTEGDRGFSEAAADQKNGEQDEEEEDQNEREEDDEAGYETATEDEGDDYTPDVFKDAHE